MKTVGSAVLALAVASALFLCSATVLVAQDYAAEQRKANLLLQRTAALLERPGQNPVPTPNPPSVAVPAPNVSALSDAPSAALAESTPVQTNVKRLALLVGVDDYAHVNKLRGCVNDVKKMEYVLLNKFGFEKQNVAVLLNQQATHAAIVKAFQEQLINRAALNSVVVFHFSGHGSHIRDDGMDEVDRLDETIVPVDSRAANIFDITDDEINGLFKQLTAKTKNVTFILDCCHSGASIRATATARKVADDTRMPPTAPPYAIAEPRGAQGPEDRFEGRDYALIAGCRADEVSFEFTDPVSHQPCGALTHFLTKELATVPIGKVTYRDVMENVVAAVNREYPTQHPQLEGVGMDSYVFGDASDVAEAYVQIDTRGEVLKLNAGAVHGVNIGTQFAVYAPGTKKFVGAEVIANIKVTKVESDISHAEQMDGGAIPNAARAVFRAYEFRDDKFGLHFIDLASAKALGKVKELIEKPDRRVDRTFEKSPLLKDVFQAVPDKTTARVILRELSEKELPDFPGLSPGRFVVLSAGDGSPLSIPVMIDEAKLEEVSEKVVDQLVRWTKWFRVADLTNSGSDRLKIGITLEPELSGSALTAADRPQAGLTVMVGQQMKFTFHNQSRRPLYFTLLDLSSDGTIAVVFPNPGENQAIAPGEKWTEVLEATLTNNRKTMRDNLKVIATVRPTDFGFLRQDQIRGLPRGLTSNQLMQILGDAQLIERAVERVSPKVDEWATATRVFNVVSSSTP